MKTALLAISLVVAALVAADANAHGPRGRVHFGVHIGAPWYWWHPWPYYHPHYATPVVVERREPPVYVERDEAAPEQSQGWWYFCEQSKTYYPYVKTCPGGWQKVTPSPRGGG